MKIKILSDPFSVCQVDSLDEIDFLCPFTSVSLTDEEISLVCPAKNVPEDTKAREDGWIAFKIAEVLDFDMVGVLAAISDVLAKHRISIFVISTYNTDYFLLKEENVSQAQNVLLQAGYSFE